MRSTFVYLHIEPAPSVFFFPFHNFYFTLLLFASRFRAVGLAATMKARVAFTVTSSTGIKKWILQLLPGAEPAVLQVNPDEKQADRPNVTLILSDENLVKLSTGALSPEYAYMRGWLEIKGQMGVALKVKSLLTELK